MEPRGKIEPGVSIAANLDESKAIAHTLDRIQGDNLINDENDICQF